MAGKSDWKKRRTDGPPVPELLWSADQVAVALNVCIRHVWAMHTSGRLPRPIRLGRRSLWRRAEVEAWLDAGAPPRGKWEATRPKSCPRR